jgi:hypothetical protein
VQVPCGRDRHGGIGSIGLGRIIVVILVAILLEQDRDEDRDEEGDHE